MTGKLDLKKTDKAYYGGEAGAWHRVTLPPLRYLALEGHGAPEAPAYSEALGALYPLAYKIKFAAKAEGRDFTVPPQSTQWWADDPSAFTQGRRDEWHWRAMIRMPDFVDRAMVEAARGAAKPVPRLGEVTLHEVDEGDCFQTLHIGPYAEEGETLALLHDHLMPGARVTFGAPHHEVYLSDPRRTAPEKLRTILRQSVRPA
ncbi:MAG: GyrI-like domain-containing protein [Pseudomonadota bacterium]|nr:GyrI-like domain-containing protein [Pseudomonadota bacterium]